MASNVQSAASVKHQISKLFEEALRRSVPQELKVHPAIAPCKDATYGDYQCNNAMAIFSRVKGVTDLKSIGEAIIGNLPPSEMIELCSCAEDGYINIRLSNGWMENSIHRMLVHGIETWGLQLPIKTAVVDFSSPNIAKEMHVGHLRSTIIGDTLARMLEYANVNVLRRNHIGDWGTQFGMLIEFFFEKYPSMDVSSDQAIGDLEAFYKATKQRFDTDPIFKEKAQKAVVSLQSGEEKYRNAWTQICEISRRGYERVYQRLGVRLEEKGESFYNPYIPRTLKLLNEKGLVKESEGASVIFIERKKIPLIVVKRDGGYNYSSTDLTALWYRLNEEKAEWIIYVTDVGQREHFEMVFAAAKKAGWLPEDKNKYPKATHVGFGLVMGEDGKRFRSRSTETVKLVDLLDEAKNRSKEALVQRGKAEEWISEVLDSTAEAVGYGAVKYADLKNNRTTNYTFNFDQMLSDKGNTAVYLQYAHARICSIILRSGKDVEELKKIGTVALVHQDERALGLHLIRFSENVEDACTKLLPNVVCEYVYNLSEHFTRFYTNCQVVGSAEETSRLLLCEATAIVMRKCFYLLGITPVYKI